MCKAGKWAWDDVAGMSPDIFAKWTTFITLYLEQERLGECCTPVLACEETLSNQMTLDLRVDPPERVVYTFNCGTSVFAVDDHCYVLWNYNGEWWVKSTHLFDVAILVLKDKLPDDPDYAVQFFNQRSSGML